MKKYFYNTIVNIINVLSYAPRRSYVGHAWEINRFLPILLKFSGIPKMLDFIKKRYFYATPIITTFYFYSSHHNCPKLFQFGISLNQFLLSTVVNTTNKTWKHCAR